MQSIQDASQERTKSSPQVSETPESIQRLFTNGSECHRAVSEGYYEAIMRGRVMATRLSHTQLHVGSTPTPATNGYMGRLKIGNLRASLT